MGTVVSVINHKGGSGKTTTVLNLIGLLSSVPKKGGKTKNLLIDLDPQQSANRCIGTINEEHNNLPESFTASPVGRAPLEPRIKKSIWDGVFYIPSHTQAMIDASQLMVQINRHMSPTTVLKSLINPIKSVYDFIVLDTGPSQGIFMWNCLVASDIIIIPAQPNFSDAQEISGVIYNIKRVSGETDHNIKILGILPTYYRHGIQQHVQMVEKMGETFKPIKILTPIPISIDLQQAYGAKLPIHKFNPTVAATYAYFQLTKDLINSINTPKPSQKNDERIKNEVGD